MARLRTGVASVAAPSSDQPSSNPRGGLSIARKLAALIGALVLSIVAVLAFYFASSQLSELRTSLEHKADNYGRLIASQVRSAVAFDDRETAREAFESLANDRDLRGAVLFAQGPRVLERWGTPSDLALNAHSVTEGRVFRLADRFLAVRPVVSREGPQGTLALELGTDALVQSQRRVLWAGVSMGCAALCTGILLALLIAHSFAKRLRAISRVAGLVAGGDLSQNAVVDNSSDEIGSLARSFSVMLQRIKSLIAEMRRRAEEEQSRLEGLVRERTEQLETRNADMRRVLDHVDQGFITIDRHGVMSEERSRIIQRWLGPAPQSMLLWDYVDAAVPGKRVEFESCWEQVVDGILPVEVALEQMPKRFVAGDRQFEIDYRAISAGAEEFDRVLVVLSDVTAVLERQRLEEEEREVVRLFSRVLQDRAGVLEFLAESHQLVERITGPGSEELSARKRWLHTLKGNAALYGLESIARICHEVEDKMQEQQGDISVGDAEQLLERWQRLSSKLGQFMDAPKSRGVTIEDHEYREILTAIALGIPHRQIAGMVEAWRLEPTELRLTRLAQQAEGLAERLGKLPLEVRVESNRLRVDAKQLGDVWSCLPHLIRNALDHGIEAAPERVALGKAPVALLTLRTLRKAREFAIEVEDTGRGIDWEGIRAVARDKGLPHVTTADLEAALFSDGVSTRREVTEVSGRGIGMSAVARAVRASGGHIEVWSEAGSGSRFRLSWPAGVASGSLAPA